MAPTVRMLVGINLVLIAMVSMISALTYYTLSPASVKIVDAIPTGTSYVYQSGFQQGEMGVLNASYWVVDPQLISGTHYIENGMLKIESDNRYQMGFGAKWNSPTYKKGDFEPWLPVFWKYHVEVTFVEPEGKIPTLVVENWIAWETGMSITAMVWYQRGSLMYSYGAFPNDYSYGILLGQFGLPNEFNATINADYKARRMMINWDGHSYNVPLQIEKIGSITKPFTHFQITLIEPGTIYIKNLKILLSNL